MGKNNAEKTAGMADVSDGPFCYWFTYAPSQGQTPRLAWCLEPTTFHTAWPVRLNKYSLIEHRRPVSWNSFGSEIVCFSQLLKSVGCISNGPFKKEVTVYFWGGFATFYGFIRAQCTFTVLNRASAEAHRKQKIDLVSNDEAYSFYGRDEKLEGKK